MREAITMSRRLKASLVALGLVIGVTIGVVRYGDSAQGAPPAETAVQDQTYLCQGPPDYDGCTIEQIKEAEAGNNKKTRKHYNEKKRWGKSNNPWQGLSKENNEIARKAYKRAVNRYEKANRGAAPAFRTWKAFKANSHCVMRPHMPAHVYGWCKVGEAVNKVINDSSKVVFDLLCVGEVLGVYAAEQTAYRLFSIAAKKLPYVAAPAAVGCAVTTTYHYIGETWV